MALKAFKRSNIADFDTSKFQTNVFEFTQQFIDNPLLSGTLVEDIAVSTTAVDVNHGLGREPVGYIMTKASAHVTIFDTTSAQPKVHLTITGSASATISLWIF